MKKITIALLALISLFTISCEIGLGAAVDTEPPSIEIQTPPVDSVIRDKFAIAGTWSDDGSIDYVKIKLDRTDGYTGSFEYAAEVKTEAVGKGSWTAVIDPVSDKVIDGSYQATVTIADTTGRKTIRNLTFNIDNTAPIVVLQRPSSIISSIDSETDTYGQIINLTGQAADDNNINTIEMNFYSDEACTTLLNTVTLNNVPATINLDVAKFVEKSENDYSKIYGYSEKKGTVTRYCKIVAYDGAQSYPIDGSNQTAEDTRGNKQENYYLYDDISTAVLSNHKITELYSMFNGTYALSDAGRSAEAADVTAIKKLLESKQNSKGKFNLNPANNPTFLLSGRSGLKKDGTDFYSATNPTTDNNITNDSTAIIEVSPGLDGISLNGDSIKVYIVECNQYGNPVDDVRFYPVTTKSKSGTGYKFVSTITNQFASANGTKKLTLGKYYLFGVEGADQNGNPIVPNSSGGYGFYFAASGAAPRLESKLERSSDGVTWTEIKDQISYLPAGTKVKVSGKVSVENGMPEFTLKLDSVDSGISFTEKTEAPFEYTFEKVYDPSAFGTESAQHSISITAIQSGGKTEKAYTVMYDLDGPVITVSEISPIAYRYTDENGNKEKESDVANAEAKKYLNGSNVSIKISITDNYDIVDSTKNKAKIEIFEGTNIAADAVAKQTITGITTPSNFKWDNINTNEIASGEITIRVTAYDRSGNETVWENTTAETPSRYFVDQTTDNPIILPSSASELSFAITAQNSMGTKNKFTSGGQLLLKLIDDDGLKSITPYEGTAIDSQTQKATVSLDRTAKETLYSYYLPTQAGFHYLRFEIKDCFDNIKSVGPFIIKISAGAPAVTEIDSIVRNKDNEQKSTSYTKGEQGADADYFENTVKFTSEFASVYVYRSTDGENFTKLKDSNGEDLVVSCTPVAASYEYKDKVKPTAETTYHYYIAGIDGSDEVKGNSQKITCKVDKTAPTLVELKALPGKEDTKATQYTFTGTAKDEGGSGIDKVYLTISDGSNSKTVVADGSTSWSYDLNYADTEGTPSWISIFGSQQGDKYIYIKAVDAAGNESTTFKYSNIATYNNSDNKLSFLYDYSNPTLNITNEVGEYMPSTGFTFGGTANDTYSVDKLEVTQVYAANDENPITTGPSTIFTKTNITPSESWTCKVPLNDATPAEGTYTYTFTLTDKKGNTVTSKQFETKVDNNAPTLTITTPSTDTELKGEDSISDEMFQFEGEITEANSMSGVYYKIVAAGTNGTASTTEPSHPVTGSTGVTLEQTWTNAGFKKVSSFGTTSWKTRQNFHANDASNPAADSLGEGKNYTLYLYGVDKAGNVSTAAKRIFDVDKSKPTVTATSTKTLYKKSDLDPDSLAGDFTINGTARDTYDLTSVQLSYVSEANSTPVTLPAFTLPLTNGEWTKTFSFGSGATGTTAKPKLDDGIYTFTIKATDKVGKVSTAERKITVDTNPPVITASSLKIDSAAYDSAKWYESKTLPISIEVSDGTGSGIAKVQVSSTAADASDENWRSLSLLEGVWTGTVQFDNDGYNNFWIRAKDNAGNDYAVQSFSIKLDTSAPKIYLTKYYVGDVEQEISGTVYINDDATKTLTLYGQYYDNDSGVKALSFTGCNSQPEIWYSAEEITDEKTIETITWNKTLPTNTASVKYWKAEFANSALKTEDLIAVGRNNAGSTGLRTDTTLFTIALDRVKPTLSQKSITFTTDSTKYSVYKSDDNYYVNNTDGKFIISGLAEDKAGKPQGAAESDPDDPASGVAEVRLSFSGLAANLQPDPSKNAYFKDIDLSSLTTGTTATLKVIDKAGNESDTINLTIVFDTQGPNGVHLMDNGSTKKDLYFRIGDQGRDDFVKKDAIGEVILNNAGNGTAIEDYGVDENGDETADITYSYTGVAAWDADKDKDVGGKYSGNTYGNAETVKLRGKFEDKVSDDDDAADGSGVHLIYYKIYTPNDTEVTKTINSTTHEEEVTVNTSNFLQNYESIADGYFSLLKEPETRRVFYTDTNGTLGGAIEDFGTAIETITKTGEDPEINTKYYTNITTNYKTTIANLNAGENYLVLVAVDNVGNAALEGVEYNNHTYDNYRINVDYESPTISSNAPAIGEFTNARQPLTITGTVKDNPSANHAGIKSVWLKYDETKANWIKADVNETAETWTATIPVKTLDKIYGSSTTPVSKVFTATATDKSGNGNTFSCNLTVTIDKTPPTVEVSVAEKSNAGTNDADVPYVNGSIKLKGTASDTNGLKEGETIKLYYITDASEKNGVTAISKWTPYTTTTIDSNNEWTLNTAAAPFVDGTTYYFTVAATDKAGNTGYAAPLALAVNKASDRPVVKFSISFSDDISSSNSELDGVISDDDGTPEVNNVWCAVTEDTTDENGNLVSGDVVPAEDSSEWKQSETGANAKFTYKATGSFTLKPGDGKKYIWFKIKDAKNTTPFISSNATTYSFNTPKLCDKDNLTTGVTSTRLIVTTDTTPPVTDSFAYLAKNKDAAIDANWLTNNNSAVFGGTNANTFKVRIFAWDKNGISSVTFKVPAEEGDNPTTATSGKLADGYYIYSLDEDTTKHPADTAKASYNCWTSGDVDVTGFASGARSCIVTTFDGTKTKEENYTFTIDNTPADFKYTTHKDNQTIYGVRAEEIRGMVLSNDVQNVYYYLTKGDVDTPAAAKTAIDNNWKPVLLENSSNEFSLVFDKDSEDTVTNDSETHDLKLRYWLKTLYNVSNLDTYDTTQALKLWVYLEDKVGNKSDPKSLSLNVIPNGGKPFVEINYPEAGAKLGGTIRFAGITTIDETSTVEKVYAQILVPGANANDWVSKLDALITDSKNKSTGAEPYYKPVTFDSTKTGDAGKGVEVSGTPSSWNFAINSHHELEKDNDTPEYTLKFIAKSASDKISDTVSRTIQIDKNAPSIGNTIPLQLVKFVDTNANDLFADSNISNRMTYQEDMWISGEWYLIGSVTDDNGVKSLLWHDGSVSHTLVLRNDTKNTGTPQTVANVILKQVTEQSTSSTAYDYHFAIKIGKKTGSGTITYKISAVDATSESNSVERTVKVNYDNTPPDFKATVSSLDGAEELSSNGISIQNSSGMYSVYGTFDEEGTQSGFERIVMYFTRTIGSGDPENIVDPMVTKNKTGDNNDKKNNYYPIGSFSYTDGIYWKELTGASTNSDTITVTVSDDWVRKGGLCKVDGVIYKITEVTTTSIKVEGTLNSGSSKKVYVSPALVIDNLSSESKKSGATYDGLYNKNGTERNVINGGDGDWMIEGVTKQSSSYPWTAAINSQNMLDGPITIHFVAFDKAGNATEKTYSGKVENNAPRLAGVTIWTDYNGNNKGWRNSGAHAADYASETKSRYYSRVRPTINNKLVERSNDITSKLIVSGNQDDVEGIAASSSTAFMKVTDTVKFIPEIVGGNGALYYEYKIGKKGAFRVDSNTKEITGFTPSTTNDSKALQSTSKAAIKNDSDVAVSGADVGQDIQSITQTDENSINYIDGNTDGVITFDGAGILGNLDNSTSDVPTWFDVIISDSTEGDTPLSCELQVALQIHYTDVTSPKTGIRPFYWNSKTDNSVEWDSGKALGHIELENDWKETDAYKNGGSSATSGELDADPKVSGKIKVEGYAYDDIKLSELWVQMVNHTNIGTAKKASTYDGASWSTEAYTDAKGWGFVAEDVYLNGNGHMVHWTLTVDTAKRTNVAEVDKAIVVYAIDARGTDDTKTSNHSGTTQTTLDTYTWGEVSEGESALSTYFTDIYGKTPVTESTPASTIVYKSPDASNMTPYYKVDVVPYITGISTPNRQNSGLKDNNIRSASGKYSIIKGKTSNFIEVKGFNLNPGANDVRIVDSSTTAGTSVTATSGIKATRSSAASDGYTLFKLSNELTKSGYLEVFTNGVRSLNNINNDNAHDALGSGSSIGNSVSDWEDYYNREPDYYNTKNVQLTDNRYLTIWDMHKTSTKNGYYPVMIMDGDDPVFGYVDANGCQDGTCTYIAQCFQPQRRKFNGATGAVTSTEYLIGGITFDQMGMAKDDAGKYFQASVYNQNGGSLTLYYDKYASLYNNVQAGNANGDDENYYNNVAWQLGTGYQGYNGNWSNSSDNNAITLDGMNYGGVLVDRYQNIKIIAKGSSTSAAGATVYQAYYDDKSGSVLFRQMKVGTSTNAGDYKMNKIGDTQYYTNQTEISNGWEQINGQWVNAANAKVAIGRRTVTGTGSKYFDLGIVTKNSNNYAVVVYYDFTEGRLRLMYSSTALNGTPTQNVTFTENTSVELPEYVGQYVSMTVDTNGGIHIAAFDSNGSDLKYIYLTSYDAEEFTEMTVDAAGSVGNWTSIKINNENKPVIAYYNATETGGRDAIKLAVANNIVGNVAAGVDATTDYTLTGWEYMTIPSIDPAQGGSQKFQQVCLDFDSDGRPVVGYLGTNLEFGKWLDE